MKAFDRIMFPVDLSESSDRIVPRLKGIIKKFNAELHVVFVARIFGHFAGMHVPHPAIKNFEAEIVEGSKKRLAEFIDVYFPDYPKVKSAVLSGDITDQMLEYIDNNKIDLVMMGTHGRKGLEKVIFGSVAERFMRMSPVPVLLINPYRYVKKTK
ncbi:MAG: universal stress protein [Deltaproteobacteria bacterium]|nr:universal stress protein [Deltaproteobacteria bacterium]MBF0523782.1 universal stress protein [Deltaproteobacteria bacterium]